jgi:dihydrofolate reductase
MAKFRLNLAMSADGYIATPDDKTDWLEPYDAEDYGYKEFIAEIGIIVMGRRTYEQVRSFGAWPYSGRRTYVLSSNPLRSPPTGVEPAREGVARLAARIRSTAARDIWVHGGAQTIGAFLEAGAVDLMELHIVPVLLGEGIRLFESQSLPPRIKFDSIEALKRGVVRLTYTIVH